MVDSLSRRHQVLGSEWTLAQEVVDVLQSKWSVVIDLFATSLNFHLPVYFSPLNDPIATGTDDFLQDWNGKLRACQGTELTQIASFWSQK